MPVEKDPKLGLYIDAFKAWLPTVRIRLAAWAEACREEPVLIWHTPAIRYSTYAVGALIGLWVVTSFVGMWAPKNVIPPARTADFHIVCTNTACRHHFVINRKFGFDDFPVTCPKCKKETGERAVRCAGGPRDGEWVAATLDANDQLIGADCSVPPSTKD